jgi:hypothetical protein
MHASTTPRSLERCLLGAWSACSRAASSAARGVPPCLQYEKLGMTSHYKVFEDIFTDY